MGRLEDRLGIDQTEDLYRHADAIATVERGAVTAIAPGTVQITVADGSLSAFLRFSVYPRSSNP